jgi:hypothetical protein
MKYLILLVLSITPKNSLNSSLISRMLCMTWLISFLAVIPIEVVILCSKH